MDNARLAFCSTNNTVTPLGTGAVLIQPNAALRIDGVEQVKESKYIMLHAPRSALPRIRELLPGSEFPTIIPLEGSPDKVAVHAVCRENVFWETLESLKAAGASAISTTSTSTNTVAIDSRQLPRT